MTPTQQAMCAVIRESGYSGLKRCWPGLIIAVTGCGDWVVVMGQHAITQQEYEQWEKKQ